ncbi:hypothetical protein [Ramlibacter tataouinensis]|uniref:Uncharacterized protein n=1 Tax=Ramlibacter tataouinensis (strain ATCC BAA-407 / DSM 14655 / LMG 21543 / TTB310) TaxID=365046 RepID=F5Y2N7_RAMTT|nr:hypothetical protein [Ramlibacter tataouinensis]AEG92400.1 hypothetical protein Rta_13130 [Ramlibacter tataouinensis TTB310]
MRARLIAGLVVLSFLWAGIFGHERPVLQAEPAIATFAAVADAGPAEQLQGSVEDHHLDDRPAQQADVSGDLPDASHQRWLRRAPPAGTGGPAAFQVRQRRSPDLDGLRRPPRVRTALT